MPRRRSTIGLDARFDALRSADPDALPYLRLAAAVIATAARDLVTAGGPESGLTQAPNCAKRRKHHRYLSAWRFFFSHERQYVELRSHWFGQAGMAVPGEAEIKATLETWAAGGMPGVYKTRWRDEWLSASAASTDAA